MLPSGWDDLCPSPDLRRKLGLAAAFIAFGSVACMSGVTLLVAENEPGDAFALARQQPESRPIITTATTSDRPAAETTTAEKPAETGITSCRRNKASGNDCESVVTSKADPVHVDSAAAAEASQSAAVQPVALIASTPVVAESAPESTDDGAPASVPEATVPEAAAAKPQKTQHRQSRRNPYDGFSLFALDHRGRARFRPLF